MKMSRDHYYSMEAKIREYVKYYNLNIKDILESPDHSTTQVYWDIMWASGIDTVPLYEYLDDNNIETSLRRVFNAIIKENV